MCVCVCVYAGLQVRARRIVSLERRVNNLAARARLYYHIAQVRDEMDDNEAGFDSARLREAALAMMALLAPLFPRVRALDALTCTDQDVDLLQLSIGNMSDRGEIVHPSLQYIRSVDANVREWANGGGYPCVVELQLGDREYSLFGEQRHEFVLSNRIHHHHARSVPATLSAVDGVSCYP